MGKKLTWDRKSNEHIIETFSFDVPPGAVTHFDASQSTLQMKDKSGHTLVALKNVHEFWLDSYDVTWAVEASFNQKMEDMRAEVKRLAAENTFYKEMHNEQSA